MTPREHAVLSRRLLLSFIDSALEEIGARSLPAALAQLEIPLSSLEQASVESLDGAKAARLYASLQQALRMEYGRRGRGILQRVGRRMWILLTAQAGLRIKTELEIVRRLPVPARRRRVLEIVADYFNEEGGSVHLHPLDLDFLLADHGSAATLGQSDTSPICFVTLGLIDGALLWATHQEPSVKEIACRAQGAPACEFRVSLKSG
jgi:predicted hydrocarbon binding protein